MGKRRKLLLQPGFLANQVIPDYERKRNEQVKRNNEVLNSFGLKGIATSLRGLVQNKCANKNGKRRVRSDDDDYRPLDDGEDHDYGSDSDLSPPRLPKNMKKKRYRTLDMDDGSHADKLQSVPQDTPLCINSEHAHQHNASQPTPSHNASHPSQQDGASQPAPRASASQPSQIRSTSRPQPQPAQPRTFPPQHAQSLCTQPQPIQPQSSQPQPIQAQPTQPQPVQPQQEDNFDMDEELFDEVEVGMRDETNTRTKRGLTRLADIWNLPPGKKIVVTFNLVGLPVGVEGGVFNRMLGTIARKPHLCPIDCKSWHYVPNHYKEHCWSIIESKFFIPGDDGVRGLIKHNTLKSIGDKLRNWRCSLRGKYYDESKTPAQVVATAPAIVNPEQYANLVNYWYSKEGRELSTANKNRRKVQNNPHTAGSKTFAQHAHELEKKLNVGVSRTMLYETTHVKSDGTPVSEEVAENLRKMKELTESQQSTPEENMKGKINWSPNDVYSQVIDKKEHSGRLRGLGFGHTSKTCGSTSNSDARLRVASDEERMREKDNYILELEDKLQTHEQKLSSTASELNTVKSVLDFLVRQSGFQIQDIASAIQNQVSPQGNQGSSFVSHEVELSLGN